MEEEHGQQGGAPPAEVPEDDVKQTDELEWRARALEAESRLEQVEASLAECQASAAQLREQMDKSEGARQIERALVEQQALDLETAALLTEAAVAQMDEPDVEAAVAELKRRKPFLFRSGGAGGHAGAMSGASSGTGDGALTQAAIDARVTGSRQALLRYLRLRRAAG